MPLSKLNGLLNGSNTLRLNPPIRSFSSLHFLKCSGEFLQPYIICWPTLIRRQKLAPWWGNGRIWCQCLVGSWWLDSHMPQSWSDQDGRSENSIESLHVSCILRNEWMDKICPKEELERTTTGSWCI